MPLTLPVFRILDRSVRRAAVFAGLLFVGLAACAGPALAQCLALSTDRLDYGPGEAVTVTAILSLDQRPESLSATVARPGEPAGTRLPIDASVFLSGNTAQFAAPAAPGEYEVRLLDGSRDLCRSLMRFRVVSAPAAPTPSPAPTSPPPPPGPAAPLPLVSELVGTWRIEWTGSQLLGAFVTVVPHAGLPDKFQVTGASSFVKDGLLTYGNAGGEGVTKAGRQFDVGWGYHTHGHWGGESTLDLSPDRETVYGNWTYGDKQGAEVWHRVHLEIAGTKLLVQGEDRKTKSLVPAGEVPTIEVDPGTGVMSIEVYGANQWGTHDLRLEPTPGLIFWKSEHLCASGGSTMYGGWGYCGGLSPEAVVGHAVYFFLKPELTSGRKTLSIDGKPVPFDITLKGENDPIALGFSQKVGAAYTPVLEFTQGDVFFVEAQFDDKGRPAPATRTVTLEWQENKKPVSERIVVHRDPQKPGRYRSGPMIAQPPGSKPVPAPTS